MAKKAKSAPPVPAPKPEALDKFEAGIRAAVSTSSTPLYDAAMEQVRAGTLKRKVLTEKGWVSPAESSE